MRGDDLPVVLRHGHGNDLIGTGEEGRKGRGHVFRSRVELSEGQGLSGVRNLQGREMRKLLGGAAEDLCEPSDSFLMRHVQEMVAVKDVGQAVFGRYPSWSRASSATQIYRLQAANVSKKKTAKPLAATIDVKTFPTHA